MAHRYARSLPVRTLLAAALLGLLTAPTFGQAFEEDFSDASQFTVTKGNLGSAGSDNYFRVDDGSNISKAYDGTEGRFLAAQDTDDSGIGPAAAAPVQVEWTGIDISSLSDPVFSGLFGSVLDGSGDIDGSDFLRIEYRLDGGSYKKLIAFRNDGATSNTTFQEDTDLDGIGEGTDISTSAGTMKSFQKALPTGSTLDLRLTAHVNSGDEDIAVDNFVVKEASGPTVQFISSEATVAEDEGSAVLTVELLNPSGASVSADVAFQPGASSATTADLENYSTRSVSFAPGASSGAQKQITVNVTNDNEPEGQEAATFALTNVSGGEATGGAFTLQLVDTEVVINEVLADPPTGSSGDANGDGTRSSSEDEFVEIYNNSPSALDLSGYTLRDGSGTRHTFPQGTVLDPQVAVVVFGGGSPAPSIPGVVQTASGGDLGLNNGGDDVIVRDPSGDPYLTFSYGGEGGDNQSLTRDPDFTGDFVKHSNATGAGGAIFSPGETVEGSALPVELASMEAASSGEGVVLSWRTASETNNAGFEVQRRVQGEETGWQTLHFEGGAGTTTSGRQYRFTDTEVPYSSRTLHYRLKQVDTDGSTHLSKEVTVRRGAVDGVAMKPPFPNPASETATVKIAIPEDVAARGEVRLDLYDTMGRQVQSIEVAGKSERRTVRFQTENLASGLYVLRLQAGGDTRVRRLTVVR